MAIVTTKETKIETEKLLREIREINEEIRKLSSGREEKEKRLAELRLKLKNFKIKWAKLRMKTEEKTDLIQDWTAKIYEVTCYKNGYHGEYIEDWERPNRYYDIDLGGDPSFYCHDCEETSNHTSFGKIGERVFHGEFHTIKVLAEIKLSDIIKKYLGDLNGKTYKTR